MQGLSINKKFFSSWNSEMSYILGFIAADGCLGVKRVRKDGTRQFLLDITSKDIALLKKIRKVMSAQQKIGLKQSGYDRYGKYYRLQIGHQEICKDLIKLGILPRKTYNLGPVKVPDKYFPDFVRGFFDGDGSVYIYNVNGTPQIKASFVSSRLSFISNLNQRLCQNLDIPQKAIHKENQKRSTIIGYNICFYIDDCEKLAEFMYGDNPTLYLSRKRRVFEKWKSIKRRHYRKQNYPSKVGWRLNQKVFT